MKKAKLRKLSIDLTESSSIKLTDYKEKKATSLGGAIDNLVSAFLGLSEETKTNLCEFCRDEISKIKNSDQYVGDFHFSAAAQRIKEYEAINKFFGDLKRDTMRKITIKGGYVVFPEDWIVTDYNEPIECSYVGVVETAHCNGEVPHFLFFSAKPVFEMSKKEIDDVYAACCTVWPEFRNILKKRVKGIITNKFENLDEWRAAPLPGCFAIADYGERLEYPCGAMIVRT